MNEKTESEFETEKIPQENADDLNELSDSQPKEVRTQTKTAKKADPHPDHKQSSGTHKKRRRRKKNKALNAVCAVVIVIAAAAGAVFAVKTASLRSSWQAKVDDANNELTAAQSAYEAIDRSTPEGQAEEKAWAESVITETQQKIDDLKKANEELSASIEANRKTLDGLMADEDTEYYVNVYNALKEGMEKVEGYIAESN